MQDISFKLKMDTDNAAYQNNGLSNTDELAEVLEEITTKLKQGNKYGSIRDLNGNTVGSWEAEIKAKSEDWVV